MEDEIKVVQYENEYGLLDTWTYKRNKLIKTEFSYPRAKYEKEKTNKVNTKIMNKKQELFEQMSSLFRTFEEEHNGSTKKSQANARKAAGEFKKLVTEYRKESVADAKN